MDKIIKETLKHYIDLEYYANGLNKTFQDLFKELEKRCFQIIESQKSISTKNSYNAVYKAIKEEVEKYREELQNRLKNEAELILNEELDFLDNLYNDSENKEKSNALLYTLGGITLSKILFAPVDGKDTLSQFTERTEKNILRAYDTSLRANYLFGQKTEDTVNQVSNNLKQVSRGIQNGIRTAIPSFAKNTDRIFFLNNNMEVVWCSTLDGNTCLLCASMSGKRFKSMAEAPVTPHCLCRCQLIGVAKLTSPVPTYEEFIESLSEEEQIEVLGKNRYEMWKNYDIKLERFVNNGNIVPLKNITEELNKEKENSNLIIPKQKFTEYVLNPEKAPDKAKVFKSALGYTLDNWKDLEENIIRHLNQENMTFLEEDKYGKRYYCDVEITGVNGNTKIVRTGWNLPPDSDLKKMVTLYVR